MPKGLIKGLLASLLLTMVGSVSAMELAELMALLAQRKAGEARFVEQRHVQGLGQPLKSSGTLSFAAPQRFARHTTVPRAESMVVEGNQVTLTRNGRSRQMALDAVPEMALLVQAVRGTLLGDAVALRQAFKVSLNGLPAQWTLQLEPLDARLAAVVHYVQVQGQRGDLRRVEVQMADGDRTDMTIEPTP